ncbi:putative major facilitator superfamily, MFS transporter superfamily [Septoria linicola]|nr:putative major facilitator superfamily, MFS transporter superfamily [Septoria linicola]
MTDLLKASLVHEKHISSGSTPPDESLEHVAGTINPLNGPDADKSEAERLAIDRRLMRKVDAWLIPWLCLVYLLCFLDRTNIGNARLAGMEKDLDMSGHDYNVALTIFFVSYAGAEPFTNLLLKKVGPRVFFTAVVLTWGLCMMCMGLVNSYSGLLVARFFLGITEAGLFPGVNYYLSCWYKRSELGLRLSIFFANAALAGSFGGLLAAAIAKMDGLGGKAGWAWIFIIEGLATMIVGVLCWWMIFDWSDSARFLNHEDRLRIRHRLASDNQSNSGEHYDKRHIASALKDWKCWAYCITEMGNFMPLYAFSLFLPTIVAGMGYSGTHAQLLTVPPYAVAATLTVFIGWLADRTQQRGICNMSVVCFGIVGFSMLLATDNPRVQYCGTFLGAMGIYPTIPNNLTWAANNTEGMYRRGILLGVVVGWGNLNGIVSSNIYMTTEKPRYTTGHAVVLAYLIVCEFGGSALIRTMLARENSKRRSGERDRMLEGMSEDEIMIQGDKRPDFLYTL